MRRRRTPGKTRHGQIKTAPEKMHRTAFAAETRAKLLKYAIALHQNAPEPVGILAIVGAVLFILIERDRIFDLVRHGVDSHRQIRARQRLHHCPVKFRHRLRTQFNTSPAPSLFTMRNS